MHVRLAVRDARVPLPGDLPTKAGVLHRDGQGVRRAAARGRRVRRQQKVHLAQVLLREGSVEPRAVQSRERRTKESSRSGSIESWVKDENHFYICCRRESIVQSLKKYEHLFVHVEVTKLNTALHKIYEATLYFCSTIIHISSNK